MAKGKSTQVDENPVEALGIPGSDLKLSRAALDIQVMALEKFELECLVKTYYKALYAIAEVECKEGEKWCYEDSAIECEHNYARKTLNL